MLPDEERVPVRLTLGLAVPVLQRELEVEVEGEGEDEGVPQGQGLGEGEGEAPPDGVPPSPLDAVPDWEELAVRDTVAQRVARALPVREPEPHLVTVELVERLCVADREGDAVSSAVGEAPSRTEADTEGEGVAE